MYASCPPPPKKQFLCESADICKILGRKSRWTISRTSLMYVGELLLQETIREIEILRRFGAKGSSPRYHCPTRHDVEASKLPPPPPFIECSLQRVVAPPTWLSLFKNSTALGWPRLLASLERLSACIIVLCEEGTLTVPSNPFNALQREKRTDAPAGHNHYAGSATSSSVLAAGLGPERPVLVLYGRNRRMLAREHGR